MESVERPAGLRPKPRVQVIDRRQVVLRPMEVEQLIRPDHAARAIWELVGQPDLGRSYGEIKAVEGAAGREPVDPRSLTSPWIYAYRQKIGAAPESDRPCRH